MLETFNGLGRFADINPVGIEQATARVREIRSLTDAVRTGAPSPASVDPHRSVAFAQALQSSMVSGQQPALSTAAMPPAAHGALQQGSGALGVQAMLAGTAPATAPPPPSRLSGDLKGLDPQLRASLEQVATKLDRSLEIVSGARTRAEQEQLYQKYLAGTGNLAAPPGTSRHESGRAADVYVDGVALANVPGARAATAAAGLGFPVPGEAWHVEPAR